MNGEGFAFFRWRALSHPDIGGDASWWAFWLHYDLSLWRARDYSAQGEPGE
jgi:hypothetical protein